MFKIDELNRLYLGVQGENAARTIIVDVSEWLKTYPGGTVSIWSKRNGENTNYTPNGLVFSATDKTISWTPDGVDTFYAGPGRCGIVLTVDSVVRKSKDIETFVTESSADIPGSSANTFDYDRASNKPSINGVELQGDKNLRELGCFDDDNLESTTKAISAGKAKTELDKKIDLTDAVAKTDIVNNLTETGTEKVLDARQGKVLNESIEALDDRVEDIEGWKPSGNGTLDQILRSNGDGTTRWDEAATQEEIGEAVTAWLGEHATQSETYIEVEDTLTVSGAAADSKTVGDKLSDLKSAFDDYRNGVDTRFYSGTDVDTKFVFDFEKYDRTISYFIPAYTSVSQGTTFAIQWVDSGETTHDIKRIIGGNPSDCNETYYLPLGTKKIRIRILPEINSGNTIPITVSTSFQIIDKIAETNKKIDQNTKRSKNLFDLVNPISQSGFKLQDGKIVNTSTDTKGYYAFKWYAYDASNQEINHSDTTNVATPRRANLPLNLTSACKSIKISHNGTSRDLEIKFTVDVPADYYTLSLDVESCDPTSVDGVVLKNVQLEGGKQATNYTPTYIPFSYETEGLMSNIFYEVTRWESGAFDTNGYVSDNKRCRVSPMLVKKYQGIHVVPNGQYYEVYKCSTISRQNPQNIVKISDPGWSETEGWFSIEDDCYVVIVGALEKNWDQAVDIDPSEILISASVVSEALMAAVNAQKALEEIEDIDVDSKIPDYYKEEVDSVLNKLSKLPPTNFNYVILTDIHYSYPNEFTQKKLNWLMESITRIANGGNIDAVLMLGDLIEGGYDANRQTSDNQINDVFAGFSDVKKPVLSAYGNHDQNMYNFSNAPSNKKNTTYYITLPEWKNKAVFPFGFDNDYYYLDVPKKNIRLIVANTFEYGEQIDGSGNVTWPYGSGNRVSKTQLDALAEMMDGTEFDIVVATHGLNTDLLSLVSTFNTRGIYIKANSETISFANKTNSIRMYHTGHYHNAAMEYCTAYNVNVISTSCASMAAVQQAIDGAPNIPYITTWEDTEPADYMHRVIPRTKGTVDETCFDVVSIGDDKVTKIGFGASADDAINS